MAAVRGPPPGESLAIHVPDGSRGLERGDHQDGSLSLSFRAGRNGEQFARDALAALDMLREPPQNSAAN